jgi:hypothetical protein
MFHGTIKPFISMTMHLKINKSSQPAKSLHEELEVMDYFSTKFAYG